MNKTYLKNSLSSSGIKNFFWPIKRTFVENVNHNLLKDFTVLSSKYDELHATLPIVEKWLIPEILKIIEAIKLRKFLQKKKLFISMQNYPILQNLMDNNLLNYGNNFLSAFIKQPKDMNIPFFFKRIIRTTQKNNFRQLRNIKTKNDHFLEPNKLALQHASNKDIPFIYTNVKKIINFSKSNSSLNSKSVENLLNVILNNIKKELKGNLEIIDVQIIKYLRKLITEAIKITLDKVNIVEKEKNCNNLWVGSSGANYFVKIICHTFRRGDSKIIAHSHGSGYAIVDLLHTFHAVELNTCDKFYTEKTINSDVLSKDININYLNSMRRPNIGVVNKNNSKVKVNSYSLKKKIKKIMYIATAYHSERLRFVPIESDTTYIDFQLRLFSFLKKKNMELFYKPHPEGSLKFHKELSEFTSVKLLDGFFEEIKVEVDAYVLDQCCTSLLVPLLNIRKPIFFFNFCYPRLRSNAVKLLKKRMYFIESDLDSNNRVSVNWEKFSDLLNVEHHQFSDEFLKTFY